jgi:hypothetical protein
MDGNGFFMNIPKFRSWTRSMCLAAFCAALMAGDVCGRDLSGEFEAKIDSLIVAAYRTASGEFPCKPGTGGSPKMIQWQDLDKCLKKAEDRVDWEALSGQIEALRIDAGLLREDLSPIVESALSAHVIPYSQVITVKKKNVLLPLTNSVLKYLPEDSLKGLPVFDKKLKKQIGTFFSSFTYEKRGGLSAANNYKLSYFQYNDLEGDLQAPTLNNSLLLDSFGVPWEDASSRPGFRLTSDRLGFKY